MLRGHLGTAYFDDILVADPLRAACQCLAVRPIGLPAYIPPVSTCMSMKLLIFLHQITTQNALTVEVGN
eukprot:scaffold120979_cov35-Prasinocladus_malaysianus.AAC.1